MSETEYPQPVDASNDSQAFQVIGDPEPTSAGTQNSEPVTATEPRNDKSGKPVLCLMGEFSAGKSTLSNLLIDTTALPVNVTATQLPPVWMSKGSDAPYRVDMNGSEQEFDLAQIEDVSVHDTNYIRVFHESPLLEKCDLIDMPGISDPNMDSEVWERVIPNADAVIWCTHATQAWRQSEAAVWSMLPNELYQNSYLLLTRMDKILSERDRMRVIKRVARETDGLFRDLFPISLTQALCANGDAEKLAASGAGPFKLALIELLDEIANGKSTEGNEVESAEVELRTVLPNRVRPRPLAARSQQQKRPDVSHVGDNITQL